MGRLDHGDLLQRSEKLAVDLIGFLRETDFRRVDVRLYSQLTASITSVASNIAEANGAISSKEFVRIITISLREAYEARTQMRIYGSSFAIDFSMFIQEVDQIIKIVVSIAKKTRLKIK